MDKRERFVLCRRDLADIGQPKRYCAKPIKKQNNLDWCETCYCRIPFWPSGHETREVKMEREKSQEAVK